MAEGFYTGPPKTCTESSSFRVWPLFGPRPSSQSQVAIGRLLDLHERTSRGPFAKQYRLLESRPGTHLLLSYTSVLVLSST